MRSVLFFAIFISIMFSPAFAVLEISNAQPKVGAEQWKQVLDSTWQGLIRRNIDDCKGKPIYNGHPGSYTHGLVCRPKSETPYDAVSEGIGYGMLLALYSNDQETFDLMYGAGKDFYLNFCEGWRKPADGSGTEWGSASDADEDIAIALIFADKLQKNGIWGNSSMNYANDAQNAVNCIWNYLRDDGGLPPGNSWDPGYNIGYFAPAWYRIFNDFDSYSHQRDWMKVIDKSYDIIKANPAYDIGMVPDWTNHSGNFLEYGLGYNAYLDGQAFFKDAIRVLWRIANDYIWFKDDRAKEFLENSLAFINLKGGPSAANFYQLIGEKKGELVPAGDKWEEFNGEYNSNTWRYRREHSHLTIGQWLTAAMAVGSDEEKIAWSSEMAKFYDWENKVDFFGLATDTTGGLEDTLHNEMYFDQFLAWFGVSLMSGTWVNVVDLLDNPVENTEGITEQPFPDPDPVDPNHAMPQKPVKLNIQINQNSGIVRLSSQSDVAWKIHSLNGKLLFSSNSREASWDVGNFKGAVAVSAISKSGSSEQKLIVIK